MTQQKLLYKNLSWRICLDVASRGTFFLVNLFIARSLSLNDFGKFAYAISLAQVFYVFTDFGINVQLMKELGEHRDERAESVANVWLNYFQLKLVLMALSFVAFCVTIGVLWRWDRPWLAVLAVLWMFSNSLLDFNQFVCNGLGRIDMATKMMFVQRSVMLVGALAPLLFWRTLAGVLVGISLSGTIGCLLSNIYFFRAVSQPFVWAPNTTEWKRILKISFPVGLAGTLGGWYLRFGAIVLAWVASSAVLGVYAAAFRVFEITYILPAAIMSIALPHLASSYRKGVEDFRSELFRISKLIFAGAAAWSAVLMFGSTPVIHILFGQKFEDAPPILCVLGGVGGMVFLNYLASHVMFVLHRQRRHLLNVTLSFCICFLMSILLIPSQGAVGAAWSLLITEVFLFFATVLYLARGWNHVDRR